MQQKFLLQTFAVLPTLPPIAQLYSIHTRYMDTGIATMFILCNSRTSSMYKCMWDKILELLPDLKNNVKIAMSDFEKASMSIVKQVLPDIKLHGCWFHYNQAIYRKWRRLGLTKAPKDILWMGMSLPLAPADYFAEGLALMQNEADKLVSKYPCVLQFLSYMRVNWLPLSETLCFPSIIKTNNIVEAFHKNARQKMGTNNINVWIFLEKLQILIKDQELDLTRLKNGHLPRRPRTRFNRERSRKISRIKEDLVNGRLSLQHFLKCLYANNEFLNIEYELFNEDKDENKNKTLSDVSSFIYNSTQIDASSTENEIESFSNLTIYSVQDADLQFEDFLHISESDKENLLVPVTMPDSTNLESYEIDKNGFCITCHNKKATYVCVPCGHVTSCEDCKKNVEKRNCPICKNTVNLCVLLLYSQE